jgi:tetrahydromethanopterin S-methyltransferase subunit F
MKKESLDEYRSNLTLHLTRVSGDIEHIKETVESINKHLSLINGRLRAAENNITAVKTVGGTITFLVGVVLAWLGIDK